MDISHNVTTNYQLTQLKVTVRGKVPKAILIEGRNINATRDKN